MINSDLDKTNKKDLPFIKKYTELDLERIKGYIKEAEEEGRTEDLNFMIKDKARIFARLTKINNLLEAT